MATIVRGTVPAEEFALSYTLEQLPELEIECEQIVDAAESEVMPLLWIRNADREEIEAALKEDATVESIQCISEVGNEYLYQMKWVSHIHLLLHMITNGQATVLDAYGRNDRWHLRLLYPNRSRISQTHEFADRHGVRFDIVSIQELEGNSTGSLGLTQGQYRALRLATERGYYKVPKDVTLYELADELGVSHQALSEQLRRGTDAVMKTVFFTDVDDDAG